jgi:hypothetical protein
MVMVMMAGLRLAVAVFETDDKLFILAQVAVHLVVACFGLMEPF